MIPLFLKPSEQASLITRKARGAGYIDLISKTLFLTLFELPYPEKFDREGKTGFKYYQAWVRKIESTNWFFLGTFKLKDQVFYLNKNLSRSILKNFETEFDLIVSAHTREEPELFSDTIIMSANAPNRHLTLHLKKVEPFFPPLPDYFWWVHEENPDPLNILPRIFGLKVNSTGLRYFVHGIPGNFSLQSQPLQGRTGYSFWIEVPPVFRTGFNGITGYWLLHIDLKNGNVAYPLGKTAPPG